MSSARGTESGVERRKRLSGDERRALIEAVASELFAERGYAGTSIDEIAKRAGVTAPVLYDHFASKLELHRRLLERHFAELREIWRDQLTGGAAPELSVPRAIDAWFAYVQSHPYAWRMLFRDTSGERDVQAVHAEVVATSRAALDRLLVAQPGLGGLLASDAQELDMAWVVMRGVLQGLAQWWFEHQQVPRERVVACAMNALWLGVERLQHGERWTQPPSA